MAKKKSVDPVVSNGLTDAILGDSLLNFGKQVQQTDTLFENNRNYMITNQRQLLSQIYVEHGLVRTVVDVPVDDGLRGGVSIQSEQIDADGIKDLQNLMEKEGDYTILAQALKWNRLFGGAAVIIMTDQDPSTKLDMEAIKEDSPLEFRAIDMWELYQDTQNTSDTGPRMKMEQEYSLTTESRFTSHE